MSGRQNVLDFKQIEHISQVSLRTQHYFVLKIFPM